MKKTLERLNKLDLYCYFVNERTKRMKGVKDFHEKCWIESELLAEVIKKFNKK